MNQSVNYDRPKFCPVLSKQFQPFQRIPPEFQTGHENLLPFQEFIIGAIVKFPAGFFFADAAPLLEKELLHGL